MLGPSKLLISMAFGAWGLGLFWCSSSVNGSGWLAQAASSLSPRYVVVFIAALFILSLSRRELGIMRYFLFTIGCAAVLFLESVSSHPPWQSHPTYSPPSSSNYHENVGVLQYVNPKVGTLGYSPNGNGGMVPSVAPPFGMTRWVPQTRENFISQVPYSDGDGFIHGFQGTHQPAIWMGESGHVVLSPGIGEVRPLFEQRGMPFNKKSEISTAYVYQVTLNASGVTSQGWNLTEEYAGSGPVPGGAGDVPDLVKQGANGRTRRSIGDSGPSQGQLQQEERERAVYAGNHVYSKPGSGSTINVAQTATSHVGFLRLDFETSDELYVFIQATRQNWTGQVSVDPSTREISGYNPQRQDYKLGPLHAPGFKGYFVARFSEPFEAYGVAQAGEKYEAAKTGTGELLGAYATFKKGTKRVEVRTGVSFVSIEQARRNIDIEVPDHQNFEHTVTQLKLSWLEHLGRVTIEGTNKTDNDHDQRTIFYTSMFHMLQYPSDFSEPTSAGKNSRRSYYSGYTDSVHQDEDSYYQSWSIWDTYRAEHSFLTMFVPDRVNNLIRSLLKIYDWSGRLPMWANVVETNIMIGTHVDAVIANALARGFTGFNVSKAWEAVHKNAYVPPERDTELLYFDREASTPDEVRAGLTSYMSKGWVANDGWSESASRTLDYAFDDFAAHVVASHASDAHYAEQLLDRSKNYKNVWNANTTFMEARNENGTWAGSEQGWTEGDDWVYTFAVPHDIPGLADLFGSRAKLKAKLDEHFEGGHNDQTNEPSHHVPYLYAAIGYPANTQNLTRQIAYENYNATSNGLSGNEDLGQMSAWYWFSALGFYPVNSASDEYVVGSPFFEKVTIDFPAGVATGGDAKRGKANALTITASEAPVKPFVKALKVDGEEVTSPILKHEQIVTAKTIDFVMASEPQSWGAIVA